MKEQSETGRTGNKRSYFGVHPVNSKEKPETSEHRIETGVGKILTRQNDNELLYLCSGEGLRFLYLRHSKDAEGRNIVWLLFKRTPEMKPYYAAIGKWCAANNFTFSDKTHLTIKYISIPLEPHISTVCHHIALLRKDVFKFKTVYVGSQQTDLSLALSNINNPLIFGFFGLASAVGLGLLPLYEMFRVRTLAAPSFEAIDWPEVFLFVLIALGVSTVRYLNRNRVKKFTKTKTKIMFGRMILLFFIALAFFTY